MVTLSADVTPKMKKWVNAQVQEGLYKSQGDVVRDALRRLMLRSEAADFKSWTLNKEDQKAKEQIAYLLKKGMYKF